MSSVGEGYGYFLEPHIESCLYCVNKMDKQRRRFPTGVLLRSGHLLHRLESRPRVHPGRKPKILCLCRKPRPANLQDLKSRATDRCRHKRKPRRPSYHPMNAQNLVGNLVVRHYHNQVYHQGRQITHGAIRQAGYWLIGRQRTVARELSKCVVCKKLRGPLLDQRMADLPAERTEVAPPFTNTGFDVFEPRKVRSRKTR